MKGYGLDIEKKVLRRYFIATVIMLVIGLSGLKLATHIGPECYHSNLSDTCFYYVYIGGFKVETLNSYSGTLCIRPDGPPGMCDRVCGNWGSTGERASSCQDCLNECRSAREPPRVRGIWKLLV